MKTLNELISEGYTGIDYNPEISLFEYGLLCKQTNNELHCFYGIGSDNGYEYNTFDCGYVTLKEINQLPYELSKDINDFLSYLGISENGWKTDNNYIHKLFSLLSYYGYLNIFGDSYDSFEIENN